MTNLEMNANNLSGLLSPKFGESYSQQRSLKYKSSIAQMKKMPQSPVLVKN